MSYYDDDYDDENIHYSTQKKVAKIANDPTKHYPNKDEGRVLRKIMNDTGLSEKEIHSIKKYRVMLSEAQKQGQKPKRSMAAKYYQNLIKCACKQTGLAPQHPETLKVLDEHLKRRYNTFYLHWFMRDNPNAKTVVKNYAN